ncbi:hypothetical protein KNV11_gp66 [Flavobacterium phage vB_FspP_elemoF_6-3D]|uniref:Uncharacterized protein n=2 Tax=Elemovirus TaxID=2948694 RepID=A0A7D7F0Y4_9CAUD|nr:hypothetical protein KNV11_gp66 [Flavobacterium phage vB_FspP_elemoF_6-3D]YP_010109117.1 hypothetical protein KNV13_gp34 [Flavobacterium phage vB_FspP_elemoD_13-5B]QMP85203.1 hypothetical protein elemo63D_phanotate40 [Flavobacterium phage vB_FspP_elemoF_6-3D]QMP85827.1 hypothetical protein elemo103D_phanotate41 [Flavobacterium phage vB_FspP_elemoE_10-3D]QMP86985.1 hypothetical protein elemo135B_phanotate34 [Flavobacterium phage vB_FspP_elemoD_13-5B]
MFLKFDKDLSLTALVSVIKVSSVCLPFCFARTILS